MHHKSVILVSLIIVCKKILVTGLNLKKNACPSLELYHMSAISSKCYVNPDVLSDIPTMTTRNGYSIKSHQLTTSDGYILTLYQILPKSPTSKNYNVFLQHGILTNGGPWVDIKNKSLAFVLADKGYTVWIGSVRGSTYANQNKYLKVNNPKFWDYNLDILAAEDIPLQLSYVFENNGQKIHYIGHSMGTSLILMLLSENKTISNSVQSATLLAPIVYINNAILNDVTASVLLLVVDLFKALNIKGLFYQEQIIHSFLKNFCNILPEACFAVLDLLFGITEQFDMQYLLVYFSYWPSGVSIFQFKQYLQIMKSNNFSKYDYGADNQKYYNRSTPPLYDLKKVTTPVCLLYGENDIFFKQENIDRLYEELGSEQKYKYSVASVNNTKKYNHLDFQYSKYVDESLYPKIFNVLDDFEESNQHK